MISKANDSEVNKILERILQDFESREKEELAIELVNSLDLDMFGESYSMQVARLLTRELTPDEEFKLQVFHKVLKFHARSGGGGRLDAPGTGA